MRDFLLGLGAALSVVTPCFAQSEADVGNKVADETARITAQAALINARASEVAAKAALNKAKIDALGLPSYSGDTKLESGAGALEATILASAGLYDAASRIAAVAKQKAPAATKFLVVDGGIELDFTSMSATQTQQQAIHLLFKMAGVQDPDLVQPLDGQDPAMALAVVSAVAGLMRAETTVSPVETSGIDSALLARIVSGKLGDSAIASGAITIPKAENFNPALGWQDQSILQRLETLYLMRGYAQSGRDKLGEKPKAADKARAARIETAIARFDAFFTKATTEGENGVVPIARAAMLERLAKQDPYILRVEVEKAGGSLINTKNLATTLGVDPVKVSGGLIASYLLTEPELGAVKSSGLLVCRSTLASLRRVQEANWKVKASGDDAGTCREST